MGGASCVEAVGISAFSFPVKRKMAALSLGDARAHSSIHSLELWRHTSGDALARVVSPACAKKHGGCVHTTDVRPSLAR